MYTTIILGVGNRRRGSVIGTCIRLPTPMFILVNIIISKMYNIHIIHCHNITLITKFQIKYLILNKLLQIIM